MRNFLKSTAILSALFAGGMAHAQTASADYTMTVDALPAFCTLSNPVDGVAGVWDLLNYTFTNGTSPTVDASLRDFLYVLVDAGPDVTGPGGVVTNAISDIDYSAGTYVAGFPVVEYAGGLGDGDAGLIDMSLNAGVTSTGTITINPFVTMDQTNFQPQNIGDSFVATFVVTCIES